MPDPTNQILALSSGFDRLSMEMSAVNLMGCHHISSVYVCEQHGVLKRELNSTCLGSLYVQDFQGATSLFEMEIVPQVETVLQLQDNWYLVYSPRSLCKIALTHQLQNLHPSWSQPDLRLALLLASAPRVCTHLGLLHPLGRCDQALPVGA
jgi:hypothetical protein